RAVVKEHVDRAGLRAWPDNRAKVGVHHSAVLERLVRHRSGDLPVEWAADALDGPVLGPNFPKAPDGHGVASDGRRLISPGVVLRANVAHFHLPAFGVVAAVREHAALERLEQHVAP